MDIAIEKVLNGVRITEEDATLLYQLPLEQLGYLANYRRQTLFAQAYNNTGNNIVTYIIDRNINYTNICNVYCKFCAFYRQEKDLDSYVITFEELDKKIDELESIGGVQILMQGGHHPNLPFSWYIDLLSHIHQKYPKINIHGFSPPEIHHFSSVFKMSIEEIISHFKNAGLGSIPGGGGEILVDRVRKKISPLKCISDEWLKVMDIAHSLGLSSSATMMFGHVETVEERIEHLSKIRSQQDKTGGFTAFICWTFQPNHTKLKADAVGSQEYLRMQALSRLFLDNIPNIQSSWVTQGPKIGQLSLRYGANDFGSVMMEENVVSKTGTTFSLTKSMIEELIQAAGYQPRTRNNWYQLND